MTEHPPIPDDVCDAAYADFRQGDAVSINDVIRVAVHAAAPYLWREWTRGRAVVELPEPDVSAYPKYEATADADQYWKIEPDSDEYGTLLQIHYPPHRLPIEEAAAFFAAGLAACANADRLIKEFLARPRPDGEDT